MGKKRTKTLILGLGNPILSDDGVGPAVARELEGKFDPKEATVIEASLGGLNLLDLLPGHDRVIIIDAIKTEGGRAGQIYRLNPEALATTRHTASPHDVNLATALELGKRLGLAMPCKDRHLRHRGSGHRTFQRGMHAGRGGGHTGLCRNGHQGIKEN